MELEGLDNRTTIVKPMSDAGFTKKLQSISPRCMQTTCIDPFFVMTNTPRINISCLLATVFSANNDSNHQGLSISTGGREPINADTILIDFVLILIKKNRLHIVEKEAFHV